MSPLFLGNHPAIDFLNTQFAPEGASVEILGDGAAYIEWLSAAGLLEPSTARQMSRTFGGKPLDRAAAEARQVREWARDWLRRWRREPGRDYTREIDTLNTLLARRACRRQVVGRRGQFQLAEVQQVDTPAELITLVATPLAELITQTAPERIKDCAASACTLWFVDRSKSHRRRFCSPTACGNRAKVAAFRERQRGP